MAGVGEICCYPNCYSRLQKTLNYFFKHKEENQIEPCLYCLLKFFFIDFCGFLVNRKKKIKKIHLKKQYVYVESGEKHSFVYVRVLMTPEN